MDQKSSLYFGIKTRIQQIVCLTMLVPGVGFLGVLLNTICKSSPQSAIEVKLPPTYFGIENSMPTLFYEAEEI